MCSNFLGMESTLAKKIITKLIFSIFWDIFILFVPFFQSCYLIFHIQNVATDCKEQNKKKNHDNWLKEIFFI